MVEEYVISLAPGAPENVPPGSRARPGFIPAPLPDIASHVIAAVRIEALMATHSGRALPVEVTEPQDVGKPYQLSTLVPVIHGRQAFSRELRVGSRFIPTDATYRKVIPFLRIGSEFPGGRSRTPCRIPEFGHGLFPGENLAILDKGVLP